MSRLFSFADLYKVRIAYRVREVGAGFILQQKYAIVTIVKMQLCNIKKFCLECLSAPLTQSYTGSK